MTCTTYFAKICKNAREYVFAILSKAIHPRIRLKMVQIGSMIIAIQVPNYINTQLLIKNISQPVTP